MIIEDVGTLKSHQQKELVFLLVCMICFFFLLSHGLGKNHLFNRKKWFMCLSQMLGYFQAYSLNKTTNSSILAYHKCLAQQTMCSAYMQWILWLSYILKHNAHTCMKNACSYMSLCSRIAATVAIAATVLIQRCTLVPKKSNNIHSSCSMPYDIYEVSLEHSKTYTPWKWRKPFLINSWKHFESLLGIHTHICVLLLFLFLCVYVVLCVILVCHSVSLLILRSQSAHIQYTSITK